MLSIKEDTSSESRSANRSVDSKGREMLPKTRIVPNKKSSNALAPNLPSLQIFDTTTEE